MRPDMVVSLIPHYNRALKQALDRAWPGTPYVTILTDIADYPPHFWIERMDQYVICGSARAAQQARGVGDSGGPDSAHFGHDSAPEVLRAAAPWTARRSARAWAWTRTGPPAWCCSAARARGDMVQDGAGAEHGAMPASS